VCPPWRSEWARCVSLYERLTTMPCEADLCGPGRPVVCRSDQREGVDGWRDRRSAAVAVGWQWVLLTDLNVLLVRTRWIWRVARRWSGVRGSELEMGEVEGRGRWRVARAPETVQLQSTDTHCTAKQSEWRRESESSGSAGEARRHEATLTRKMPAVHQ
jgi:hypothetical protein